MTDIIVKEVKKNLLVDSRDLAKSLQIKHRSLLDNIDNYINDLKTLGSIAAEAQSVAHGGRDTRFFLLNEDHCYFLLTICRMTPHVKDCRLALIQAFKKARENVERVRIAVEDPIRMLKRDLAKSNFHTLTSAISHYIIEDGMSKEEISELYSYYVDMLNVAVFGKTAEEWREENDVVRGSIRDDIDSATEVELHVLSQLETIAATLIRSGHYGKKLQRMLIEEANHLFTLALRHKTKKRLSNLVKKLK